MTPIAIATPRRMHDVQQTHEEANVGLPQRPEFRKVVIINTTDSVEIDNRMRLSFCGLETAQRILSDIETGSREDIQSLVNEFKGGVEKPTVLATDSWMLALQLELAFQAQGIRVESIFVDPRRGKQKTQ